MSGKLSRDEGVEQLISAAGDVEEAEESDDRPNDRKLDKERSESEQRRRAELSSRQLCESIGFTPTATEIRVLAATTGGTDRVDKARSFARTRRR